MIITVDPSQSEDIAAFAMVKQYRLQALNVTLNGGTGVSAWQAVQGGEGYTQTVVTPVTGIELVYEDPNAIVSYTVENDDTSNYDVASDAGIILSSIEPTTNAWTYTCVFHADSVPVSSVDIDLLVYGNVARGTEQQGSPATAEEITAQVLAGLETRVTALETEMPDKADKADTYTKTQIDNAVVHKTGNETIAGTKTFTSRIDYKLTSNPWKGPTSTFYLANMVQNVDSAGDWTNQIYASHDANGTNKIEVKSKSWNDAQGTNSYEAKLTVLATANGLIYVTAPNRGYDSNYASTYANDVVTFTSLGAYTPMVKTSGNQSISGIKTFIGQTSLNCIYDNKSCQNTEGTGLTWRRLYYNTSTPANQMLYLSVTPQKPVLGPDDYGLLMVGGTNGNDPVCSWILKGSGIVNADFVCTWSDATGFELWVRNESGNRGICCIKINETSWGAVANNWVADQTTINANFDPTTYTKYKVSVDATGAPVTLTGAQTIAGTKNFSTLVSSNTLETIRHALPSTAVFKLGGDGTNTEKWTHLYNRYGSDGAMTDKDATAVTAHTTRRYFGIYAKDDNNTTREIGVSIYNNRGTGYITAPNRGYDSNNASTYANDVVTFTSLGAYTPMVRTTGNQTITGTKVFSSKINGIATGGDASSSEAMTIGHYKSVYRIKRTTLSTFRGVAIIGTWQRAVGASLEFVTVSFHGDTATGINRFGFEPKTCEYFVSADNDYVYIGLKATQNTLSSTSKQLSVIATGGFNQVTIFEGYDGTASATVEGTLIAETS